MDGNLHVCSSGEGETDGNDLLVYNTCMCGSLLSYFSMYIATQGSGEGKHSSQSI